MALDMLPPELQVLILSKLDDFGSLASAIFTCRNLYSAFSISPETTATQILVNQVGLDILPEAVAAFVSRSLPSQPPEASYEFFSKYLGMRCTNATNFAVADCARFSKLHACVEKLARMFADDCSAKLRQMTADGQGAQSITTAAPTGSEMDRFKRVLYRFEIFCNVFRCGPTGEPISDVELNRFCICFAPWENEQLGCALEFLFRLIGPAFNEVAAHDIAWGKFRVQPVLWPSSTMLQGFLSQGLEKIDRIASATLYSEKYAELECEYPPVRADFLYRALRSISRIDAPSENRLADFTQEEHVRYLRPPFFDDPDSGPSSAWEREHLDEVSTRFVYQPNRMHLREWGYVMWDQMRLDGIGALDSRRWSRGMGVAGEETREVADIKWTSSWKKRAFIYDEGGRGWWDPLDEGRVVWPRNQETTRRPRASSRDGIRGMSLEEAKQALLAMSQSTLPYRLGRTAGQQQAASPLGTLRNHAL
ncbi:hypothetical protein GQ53DRAFT_811480 [Thozetella sp. PMI_491]|nr:hypothetical protein GQ53DRAFT_811480 [Thozetella sp. PMI_491]